MDLSPVKYIHIIKRENADREVDKQGEDHVRMEAEIDIMDIQCMKLMEISEV